MSSHLFISNERHGAMISVSDLLSISHAFESHQRLLLVPWARNITLIA